MKKQIILAGGSGFLGQALAEVLLTRGYEVTVLTRGGTSERAGVQHLHWDGKTLAAWAQALDGARAVVNLAGKNINCRHTAENRAEIIRSRVDSVRVLGDAISHCAKPPDVFVQASATGFYGDTGHRAVDENAPSGNDFMAEVCRQWGRRIRCITTTRYAQSSAPHRLCSRRGTAGRCRSWRS
jgi:NAD dependent epimerase/dehydratase family enzyme